MLTQVPQRRTFPCSKKGGKNDRASITAERRKYRVVHQCVRIRAQPGPSRIDPGDIRHAVHRRIQTAQSELRPGRPTRLKGETVPEGQEVVRR